MLHRERHDLTSKRSAPRPATVRLMPSTAIEPLCTMSGARLRRKADRQPVEVGVRRSSSTWPIASTCPCTKWPPKRLSARSGRSRFTSAPARERSRASSRAPSRGRRRRESRSRSARITVRHTPLTARLSPGVSSGASGDADAQAEAAARRLALDQLADRFNEAREHIPRSARRARAARRAGRAASADENDRSGSSGTPPAPSTCGVT